jgi:hypothetical protein
VIRDEPRWFLNVPSQQQSRPHVRIVADCGDYLVIEKLGEAGELAEQLDTTSAVIHKRAQGVAENELLFSKVNEQIMGVRDALLPEDGTVAIFCECGLEDCEERISVDIDDYLRVRDEPVRFALRPDHVIPDLEDVVAEHASWVVIEKREPVKSALEEDDSQV